MKTLIITVVLAFYGFNMIAQEKKVIKEGNWVVVSNIKTPKNSTVMFYNDKQELIYSEVITNKRLNIERKKVKLALNQVLEKAIETEKVISDKNLVITALKAK
ncbi:hypothetical protein [Pedobacter puniceum]|uniref:DUF4907 domain-containing protein n=1 Tax=Pedobacter puniceum TaxID=2666136 RepID=A0A7K0FRA5_9SPHI|nr:hypothetical protein [Pedobacter puniceum]MRX48161.1 hypothetical protein [Pedobacter puniceum]